MPDKKFTQLHQKVVDTVLKVKATLTNNNNLEEERLTFGERFADTIFSVASKWKAIFVFAMALIIWILYNEFALVKYRFDPFPFPLMTFILAGIAAIQAPIIMVSEHRQHEKNSKRVAADLKAENEIMALHQSITVLIEQQLQQVHENQLMTIEILKELHQMTKVKQANQNSVVKLEVAE
jgi:uncharacterized membrane protein